MRNTRMGWLALLTLAAAGCGEVQRAELEKTRAELAEARAELAAAQAELETAKTKAHASYLDELERLEALRKKGVLTQEEFEAKKKAALAAPVPAPAAPARPRSGAWTVDELAKEFRLLRSLFNNGTINSADLDRKKSSLVQKPIVLTDLKKDLETLQGLFNDGTINAAELSTLKTKILEIESAPPRKK
jgi:hypothetical protein